MFHELQSNSCLAVSHSKCLLSGNQTKSVQNGLRYISIQLQHFNFNFSFQTNALVGIYVSVLQLTTLV